MGFTEQLLQFDGNLLIGIQNLLNADWLTPIMKGVSGVCTAGAFSIILCALLVAFKKTRKLGLVCTASLALAFVLCNLMLKPLVCRTRPWLLFPEVQVLAKPPKDASFPSGHAMNTMAVCFAWFMYTIREKGRMHNIGIALVIFALLVGLSRLYLGMHFPSDVISGLLLGMLCATIMCQLFKKCEGRDKGLLKK